MKTYALLIEGVETQLHLRILRVVLKGGHTNFLCHKWKTWMLKSPKAWQVRETLIVASSKAHLIIDLENESYTSACTL